MYKKNTKVPKTILVFARVSDDFPTKQIKQIMITKDLSWDLFYDV